jgi:hypothetical protein
MVMMFWIVIMVPPQLFMASTSTVGGMVEAFLPPTPQKTRGGTVVVGDGRQVSPLIRWASSSPSTTPISSSTTKESSSTTTITSAGTTASHTTSTPEQRAAKAKQTWSTIALHPMTKQGENNNNNKGMSSTRSRSVPSKVVEISLASPDISTIYNPDLFHEFLTTIRGTYYINGLASCQVGDRLLHPFEAHGVVKSLVFHGKDGRLTFSNRLIETELNRREVDQNQVLARGVMSTHYDSTSLWGAIGNAFSPTDRDTANLVANLWPLPDTSSKSGSSSSSATTTTTRMEPLLITCTDNGEPHVLDPLTLETKGKLIDVVPKLKSILSLGNENSNNKNKKKIKFLAHTRYDERRERFIMCTNHMDIPGEGDHFQGNSTYEFLEFDSNFDLVTSRSVTTRFMVAHE